MSDISASAAANFDGDLGDWIGVELAPAEDASRKVTLSVEQFAFERAVTTDRGYYAAITQASPGKAAWWVYSADDIILTLLSDESDYASRLAGERKHAHDLMLSEWAGRLGGMIPASPVYTYPVPTITMRAAVALATGANPGNPVAPVIGALQGFDVGNEALTLNNSARITTKYRPTDNAELLYSSNIVSALTRKPLVLTQTSPGVFELPEPGYGAIIVAYATQRRLVSVAYEAFSGGAQGYWTDAVREQFARDTLLTGNYPDSKAPPVMMLVTSRRTHAQAIASAARQVNDVGSAMAAQQQQQAAAGKDGTNELSEQSRSTVTKRIVSSKNPNQWVEVEVATDIVMRAADGKDWVLHFNEGA